jgi:putrescine transport system ATP-binding protein
MMFQSYALFPHMTVEQNIAFGLKQDGMPAARSPSASPRCWNSSR